jgi:undecaprenyl-diphosphatase
VAKETLLQTARRRVGDLIRRYGMYELPALVILVLALAGIWGFAELADEVVEEETHAFDEAIILSMRSGSDPSDPVGPRWVEELGRDMTALGGVGVLTLLTLSVAGFLLLHRKKRTALLVIAAVGIGVLMSTMMKIGFDRPRPDLVPHQTVVYTASFPSGHSMLSAVTYLTLGALLARIHRLRRVKIYLLGLALMITMAVGVSRIYLGVHWPTDVLGGWALGSSWALLCWLVALRLQRRGRLEGEVG